MAQMLVSDALWAIVEPLLPQHPPSPKGGHPRVPDRVCLTGLIFLLKNGLPWEEFPQEMGCCGMTLHNRLQEWHRAGVWDRLHRLLLDKLRGAGRIDFSRVAADSGSVRAMHGGKKPGPAPWTAARRAPSTSSWSTRGARRWSPGSRRPMSTM